jgi:tetratricopeptide (TPR) repeat protein
MFCGRCGGSLEEESPGRSLSVRLQRLRHLLRNRIWEGLSAVDSINNQIRFAKEILAQDPGLGEVCGQSLEALRRELETLEEPPVLLLRWLPVATACLELFRTDQAASLRGRVSALQAYVDDLTAGEKTFAQGKAPPPPKVQAWFAAIAEKANLRTEDAKSYLLAAPQFWPHLAASFDPSIAGKAKLLRILAQGMKALRANDFVAAQTHFEAVVAVHPLLTAALEGLAAVHIRLQRPQEAIPYLRQAVELGTRDANTYNSFAWFVCTATAMPPADQAMCVWAALRAVELAPIAAYWDTLAEVLFQIGDLRGAVAATREAIRDQPDRTVYRERMARLCAALPAIETPPPGGDEAVTPGEQGPTLEGGSEATHGAGDTGTSLAPSDSGLNLDDGDTGVNLAPSDSGLCLEAVAPDLDEAIPLPADEDFQLVPSAMLDEEDSGSQVIALEDSEAFGPPASPLTITDQVQFSVTAPSVMLAGKCYVIDVWAHLAEHRQQVLDLAREAQGGDEIRVKSKLGVKVARGSLLLVQLDVRGLVVPDPEETLSWDGDIANASFPVEVPAGAKADSYPGTAVIHVDRIPLAKIHFVVTVGRRESPELQAAATVRRYTSAFASYASRDRDQVLARIQGIQKVLPDLDVFLDVASLHSGQNWQDRLVQEITHRDVFYLFWSEAASKSPWVEREWKMALEHKGINAIDPIPLVSPEVIPPPPALAGELHFNDWVLAYMRGAS